MPSLGSSAESSKQLHNRIFHCGGKQSSIQPLGLHILKDSRQLRLDFNLDLVQCVTSLNCVCLHVVEMAEWCKSRWFWIFPVCFSAPVLPWGGPCVHGKVTASFQMAFWGSARRHHKACTADTGAKPLQRPWPVALGGMPSCCQKLTFNYDAIWKVTTPCW